MDRIYGGASITIVNAAGDNSDCGLPGVSEVTRTPVDSFTFAGTGVRLVRIPLSGRVIERSRWASRGWTLQEGVLSNRRLVFTSSHVYYQCRKWWCHEFLPTALSPVRFLEGLQHDDLLQAMQAFPYYEKHDTARWWHTFVVLMDQYRSRSLTYDSDALIAFVAILQGLNVNHFWGIPFRLEEPYSDAALMWRLLWKTSSREDAKFVLRDGFPTWSWAAWKGQLASYGRGYTRSIDENILELSVATETITGERCSLADYCSMLKVHGNLDFFRPLLHVQGWMTTMRFARKGQEDVWPYVFDCNGRLIRGEANIMDVVLPKEPEWNSSQFFVGTWPVLVLVDRAVRTNDKRPIERGYDVAGLILKPCEDGNYQTLGKVDRIHMDMVRSGGDRLELRGNSSAGVLVCERRSITLS
ncbi:hypothetical protein E8E13_000984 [Curvularia kusanoi]|uniref:Heterokaryon incompatibility domain-containing protein n=1 Tax=Curvularia kusanoi TaxID=90978 RepID=A0A9P4W5R4_CURKU|nr:hypothetical protein E8E13_000984 [Curvularia kusanoi]